MGTSFHWDVFISHSSADKPRVRRLADRLRDTGLRVWFDAEAIAAGGDIVTAIEGGLEHSRVLVLCMTPDAFKSEWVRLERNSATFRDPGNHTRRFVPLLMEDCTIPAVLRRLKYIDWRSESAEAWRQLLDALQPGAAPLPERPASELNPFDPYNPALGRGFVGRMEELRRLHAAVENAHSVSLVGDWRSGKTSLLAAFADQVRDTGRLVCEVSGTGPEGRSLTTFVREVTGRQPLDQADDAADRLSDWAAHHNLGGLHPVLVVDEIDGLLRRFDHRFFERLRGMLDRLMLVVGSRRDLDLIYEEVHRTSPFHNRLEIVRLGLLESSAVEDILSWADNLLTAGDASLIREWSGRHAYFVQLLSHHLTDARQHGVSKHTALDRFCEEAAARFRELWRTLSPRDQEDLRNAPDGTPATRRSLRTRGLVTEDGQLFGRVLAEWLSEGQA